jgi:hypothetical protein
MESKRQTGASKGELLPSKKPDMLRRLCQIANLVYAEEGKELKKLEKATQQDWKDDAERYFKLSGELAWEYQKKLIRAAKEATQEIWPELWSCSEPLEILRHMRNLLRNFWSAENERARDWAIHRAREYYQRHFVLPQMSQFHKELDEAESQCQSASTLDECKQAASNLYQSFLWINIQAEKLLDDPPASSQFENALFKLQQCALEPSRAPHKCENPKCTRGPYFFKSKTRRRYCSRQCSIEAKRRGNLKSWHKHKNEWRPK